MPISAELFKETLSRFCSGVTIVTTGSDDDIHGLTVSAFTSLSLDPPQILVCIKKSGSSHALLDENDVFGVNILSEGQQELAARFADPDLSSPERFAGAEFVTGETGVPLFPSSLAHLECRISDRIDAGDHSIFIGEAVNASVNASAQPLLYYDRGFRSIAR